MDEKNTAYGRGSLMRLMLLRRSHLNETQRAKLEAYFARQPALGTVYAFCQDLNELFRVKSQTRASCGKYVATLLENIRDLKDIAFLHMKTLGSTLKSWKEEVACMFRFVKNNGITEGFHRKIKLIQRRAYGFRNFENYRLRVRVLCS